jgi:hypothetical protein
MAPLSLLLAALLASAPAPPAAPPAAAAAPAPREMLDAFKAACSRVGNDIEPVKADAVRSGWTALAGDGDPRITRLLKLGRDAVGKDEKATAASFRRSFGGRDIFLVVSRYEDKTGYWGSGCRLYHFEATEPLDAKLLERWMGKPPTGVEEPAPGLVKRLWEPSGWRDGITVEAGHVPQKHPLGERFGLSGNVLTAQAIGGF